MARRPRSGPGGFVRALVALLLTLFVAAGLLWLAGPALLAPVDSFAQGPSGVAAYVSLSNQLRTQTIAFLAGRDVSIRLNDAEFSSMLSSALLSGRNANSTIQRVRGRLTDGEIWVDLILNLTNPAVPSRFRGPVGLQLRLIPEVTDTGEALFRIEGASVGRVPVSPAIIRAAGQANLLTIPGLDAQAATISLPLGDLISQTLSRRLEIKRVTVEEEMLSLTIALPRMR